MSDPTSNIPEYSVSEISGAVKRTLEGAFGRVRVRGEITEYKRYPSGHMYLSLKDEGGKIRSIVWKTAVPRLGLVPENGVEVIATGRVSSYGERSEYSLIIETMAYAGVGALLARIEMLRVRLTAEGLFEAAGKRKLPMLPDVIGVVTSAQGAVLQDIRTTLERRFPRPLLVWPVPVQGEGAADRIARAIQGFDRLPSGPVPRPDVLIVARGGGSLEDLMAFNDEAVVRAAALCRIPLISAVGHETDHTLIDLAADRRAPTPTAAAELAVPARDALLALLEGERTRLAAGLRRQEQELRLRLSRAERGLPDPHAFMATRASRVHRAAVALPDLPTLVTAARLALDGRGKRMRLALPNLVRARRTALMQAERGFPTPPALMAQPEGRLQLVQARLGAALRHATQRRRTDGLRVMARLSPTALAGTVREARARLEGTSGRLEAMSPLAVLSRGYALVTDAGGHTITSSTALGPGSVMTIRFADGSMPAVAGGVRQGRLPL